MPGQAKRIRLRMENECEIHPQKSPLAFIHTFIEMMQLNFIVKLSSLAV